MRVPHSARFGGIVALGAVSAATAGLLFGPADSAFAGRALRVATVGRLDAPFGLQGSRGTSSDVGIPFSLIDETRRKTDVEFQYGTDRNGDGKILDDEFRPATENRNAPGNTRKNKAPQLFTTAGDIGAGQQFVWKSAADVHSDRLVTAEYELDPQGREVDDPDNPGNPKFAPLLPGVTIRARAVRMANDPVTGTRRKIVGDWKYLPPPNDRFSLNNNNVPVVTIDAIDSNGVSVPTASDEYVHIHWTVSDADSEDLNGNGTLDVEDGEDKNDNGILDTELVGIAFDYHRVQANENPEALTSTQLEALSWLPCSRAVKDAAGDRDDLVSPVGGTPVGGVASAPAKAGGRSWVFSWDSLTDVGTAYAKYIFRARPFDQKREHGGYAFFATPVQLDNWRIFNQGGPKFPVASLASGRVGHTVTHLSVALDTNSPLDRGDVFLTSPFQSYLVAGGATSLNGGGVSDLDLISVNTVASETSTSARVHFLLQTARAFHTATALDDGRVLFVGGFDASGTNPLASTEIYDPKTRTVSPGPNLQTPRARHAAVRLASGDVAVFGGVGSGGNVLSSCELIQFKPAVDKLEVAIPTNSWTVTSVPSMAVAQHSLQAVLLPSQKVLVTGGIDASGAAVTTAQLFDPLHDDSPSNPTTKDPNFTTLASSMREPRRFGTATALLDGNVLFAGGASGTSGAAVATMELFNAQTNEFEQIGLQLQFARAQHTATLLGDGSVLVTGGTSGNPTDATPALLADADVIRLGARTPATGSGGVWAATQQQVNGDLTTARRSAVATAIDNGRVFIVGGAGSTAALATQESYTPSNGSNLAPKARATLPSPEQAWLFGAPVYYRLTDPELDPTRVIVQFIDRSPSSDSNWRACTPQAQTIGGDSADYPANLAVTLVDDPTLVIDPVSRNTPGDHAYIWSLSSDIFRPAPGQTNGPYNVRVVPFGAIRGTLGESAPITVLYNTKIVPTILPFENYANARPDVALPAGALTPNQGGDIRIWVHLRDLDGGAGRPGDAASCLYEYAVDKNGDGLIRSDNGEGFAACAIKGAAVGHPTTTNPQTNLTTYYEASSDSDPAFGLRPSAKGWTFFDWDCVRDLGAPVTTFSNVWIRVTPSDTNTGFSRVVRNLAGQPPVLTIIKHPDSIYLLSWRPRYSNSKTATPLNDPIDLTFNGQVEPSTFNSATVPFYRGTTTTSQVRGQYLVVNNPNNTATLTFFPDPQSLSAGTAVFGQTAASTVLFPLDDYSFRIPGYVAPGDPQTGTTLRVLGQTVAGGQYSTYRLIQSVPTNTTGTDPNAKFRTAAIGVYADDQAPISNTLQSPSPGTILVKNAGQTGTTGASFSFSRAIDPNTAISPNITATLVGSTTGGTRTTVPIVPGRWTVTNTQTLVGTAVTSTSVATFVPLFQMPPNTSLQIGWNTGLKAVNGRSLATQSFTYTIENYTRTVNTASVLESFSNTTQRDSTTTTASWGTDGCAPGALSGATSGLSFTPPLGGGTLSVTSGTTTLTLATNDYSSISVSKGATLVLDSQSGPMTLRSSGNITISGTVLFAGKNGANGGTFNTGSASYPYYYWGGAAAAGTRLGGLARNGGGAGGNSVSVVSGSSTNRVAGSDGGNGSGTSTTYGQGGPIPTETSTPIAYRYLYGAGGGAGGGNSTAGFAGGRAMTYFSTSSGYGAASTPGASANDAFLTSGMTGGGGGGGGGTTAGFSGNGFGAYGYPEGGAGGAGAGAVSIICSGIFNLTPTGLIDGRGGNGGESSHCCGSGGGGAGGNLRVIALGGATFDGVVDLRGGIGGPHGFQQYDSGCLSNVGTEKSARFGGDGAPGRLIALAPNMALVSEVRVFGQMMLRKITTLPTSTIGSVAPPVGLDGQVVSTTVSFGSTSEVHYSSLTVASGATVDLIGTSPVSIFVDGAVSIAGTLRLNGRSTTSIPSGGPSSGVAPAGMLVNNPSETLEDGQFRGYVTYPNGDGSEYTYNAHSYGSYYYYFGGTLPAYAYEGTLGMKGNLGGGKGGDGAGGLAFTGLEGGNGAGPAPGMHNINTSGGYYPSSWYIMGGDAGGSGGANATDGEDGWATYTTNALYNYLGSFNDTTGAGTTSQSGRTTPTFPKRLGLASTDPSSAVTSASTLATYLSNFKGSGGGGGNEGGGWQGYAAIGAIGGGGGGSVGIVSPNGVTISGTIEARGGDGATAGSATSMWNPSYARSGAGGGSGGTVYIASNNVSITAASSTGSGGATIDVRGGLGGGRRSQHTSMGLTNYPEYFSTGSFGGSGGFGRLVVDYTTSLNNSVQLVNRWGMEQTSADTTSNTFKTLAGSARYYCPGLVAAGGAARSLWYDMKSISPIMNSFVAATNLNASLTLRVEGAQSLPNTLGTGTGSPDPNNTSGLFTPTANPFMTGWRWLRWDASFTRTTTATGAPVTIDNLTATWTSDL